VRHDNADRLFRDLRAAVADLDKLIGATAGDGNAAITAARERISGSLERTKDALAQGREYVMDEAKDAAKSVDRYAQEHVWQVIGVAAGVGLLVGILLVLSQSSRSRRD
jgi:ElaB/YqjD/DUF883 family membrane-anchored ribosome-binding protein